MFAYQHTDETKNTTSHDALCISYSAFQKVRPCELGEQCWRDVAKGNDALWGRWGYKVECSGEDDHVKDYRGVRLEDIQMELRTVVDQPEKEEGQTELE